jgi:hypothetical protein
MNGMVTSRATLNKFRKSAVLQKAINGVNMIGVMLSNADLRAFLSEEYGLNNIVINDDTYGVPGAIVSGRPTVISKRCFPEIGITFFAAPNGGTILGDGLWGDAPETDAGVETNNDVTASSESPYVTITQWAEHDPAVLWTKASTLFMPILYKPDSLYIATAIETPAA